MICSNEQSGDRVNPQSTSVPVSKVCSFFPASLSPTPPAWLAPSSWPSLLQPALHLQPVQRSQLLMHPCPSSAPDTPGAPHFSWGQSRSPQGSKALPGLATAHPPAFATSDLVFSSLFLQHRASQAPRLGHLGPAPSFFAVGAAWCSAG